MSNYTIAVAWSGKDALSDSDAAKVISGADFNTEFTTIQTAVNTKADLNGSTTEAFNSSNLAAAGTLAVTGATTLSGATTISGATTAAAITASGTVTLNGSVAGTGVKDEDDMASDSATAISTQQSIKAYVDAQVATATMTWTYITRHTLFTSTTGNHNTATSASIPTAQVPATASAIILTFLTQADETTTTANIAATGIAEREVGKAFAPNNSDDAAGSYNTITIPYKSSVDIKWVTGNTGNASNKVLVYIDGYIT